MPKKTSKTVNIFDTMIQSSVTTSNLRGAQSELDRYLDIGTEQVDDAILWWTERKKMYPCLSRFSVDQIVAGGSVLPCFV